MASYTRLGSYLLTDELTADPFGKIHRALTIAGTSFEKHVLVRTFSEELLEAGLGAKIEEAAKVLPQLAGTRGFGAGHRIEAGRQAHVVCDYVPGRSLAQVIEKTKQEQIPLGVDHALTVLQGLAQSLIQLNGKGLSHGILSPHSVWLSYEGATNLLDAPFAAIIRGILPKARVAEVSLERYRREADATPLQQDLFALGAILYELLTLEKLPQAAEIPAALSKATLRAAQESEPIPGEILGLLRRLLAVEQPFENTGAFNAELERVLYDGDYSPTTFNMAFFMHTLFREEAEHDLQAMKADQAADFSPFVVSESQATRSLFRGEDGQSFVKYYLIGGGVLAAILAIFGYIAWDKTSETRKLREELAKVQQEQAQNEIQLRDIGKQESSVQAREAELLKKKSEAKSAEEKKQIEKQIAEAKQQKEELQKQKEEMLRKSQELQRKGQSIAQLATQPVAAKPAEQPKPAPQPQVQAPAPRAEAPRPAVAQPTPQAPPPPQAQPQPQAPSPAPQHTAPAQESQAQVVAQAAPVTPPAARQYFSTMREKSSVTVQVRVFVDSQGRPQKVSILNGVEGPYGFNENAQDAALRSKYQPATRDGRPVAGFVQMAFTFVRR